MPNLSSTVTSLRASVFASINARMRSLSTPPICLHIGDTYAVPPHAARWENMDLRAPQYYRYSHPFGTAELLGAVGDKLRRENDIPASSDWVQITCGATQALHCAVHTLIEPGQGVLLLAPYWPLFGGMVRCLGAESLEVDCTGAGLAQSLQDAYRPHVRALYFSNPNNPDGRVYSRDELGEIAAFAQRHDLWVISDECYEHYLYDDRRHVSIASLPGMAERTVTCFSFSKSYAMAGHRLGYAVATPAVAAHIRRFANHTVYNVSESIQRAGAEMLNLAPEFVRSWLPAYARARDRVERTFARWGGVKPQGGAYYFLDLGTPERAWELLERALEAGVVFAPGAAFGESYAHRLRVCFTCVDEPTLDRACAILERLD
jgi:aspartate aminotransferase